MDDLKNGSVLPNALPTKQGEANMNTLELAYAVDLLKRLTESIETYLKDDRWDGIEAMHREIKESNRLIRKYYARLNKEMTA